VHEHFCQDRSVIEKLIGVFTNALVKTPHKAYECLTTKTYRMESVSYKSIYAGLPKLNVLLFQQHLHPKQYTAKFKACWEIPG
jgi:hypothetical protein